MLVKVGADADTRGQVLDAVQLFRAKVVDVAADAITVQVTGNAGKLADFLRIMEPFGIRELVQSGRGRDRPRPPLDLGALAAPGSDTHPAPTQQGAHQWLRCSTTTTPTWP